MPLLCKQRALYVKGCVIPNGITDSQGDTLYKEDIKKIFTTFNNQDNFEIYHEELPLQEVSLLENYISSADESIGNLITPAGSWNCVIRVDNPEIQEDLLTGKLGGISLSNRIADRCKANLHGTIRYKDVADAECVIPVFISFVEGGANGYPLHVMDYDAYILKSKDIQFNENGGHLMDFKEFLNGLKSLIKEAEDTPSVEEPAIEKEDKTTEDEQVDETETTTEEDEPVVEKEEETATEEDNASEEKPTEKEEEPTVEKAEETPSVEETPATNNDNKGLEERVAALEKIVAELKAEKEEAESEGDVEGVTVIEEEPATDDTPKITKSEKVVIEESNVQKTSNYYTMTGRDPLTGKKNR